MSNSSPKDRSAGTALTIASDEEDLPATLDENGFDPAEYDWVPVKRKRRDDGWTPQRQRQFIEELADTGSVTQAALSVGMSASGAYRLRRLPEGAGFSTAWDIAIQHASRRLIDLAFDRAVNGSDEPVFDRSGNCVGRRCRYNDRLLMFLLRAHQPERFRLAHRADRAPDEALPAALPPMADALSALAPVTPAAPHLLMEPDDLEAAIQIADIMDGELPHFQRVPSEFEQADAHRSRGEAFDKALAAARREADGPRNHPDPEPDDDYWDDDAD